MPTTLPNVRGSSQPALYPVTMTISFDTDIGYNANASEQRAARRTPLWSFELPYSQLLASDKASQNTFFDSVTGMALPFSLTLGGTTYSNLVLDQDELAYLLRTNLLYNTTIKCHQTQNLAHHANAPLTTFPTLSNGALAQLPFVQRRRYLTSKVDQPSGPRYAWQWYGSQAPSGFPTTALFSWDFQWPVLIDADATTLINAFIGWSGRLQSFTLKDPVSGTTYSNCRLDNDQLAVQFQDYNRTSMAMTVVQTNG